MSAGVDANSIYVAVAHHQAGRFDDAEALYRAILAAQPRNSDALQLLGLLQSDRGNHLLGMELLRQAIAINPNVAAYHGNLGMVLAVHGRTTEAIAEYREALRLNPAYPEAQNNLALALEQRGEIDEAVDSFRKAIYLRPQYEEAHIGLANALWHQGGLDEALSEYRRAIALNPRSNAWHNLLFALHFHPGVDRKQRFAEHLRWAELCAPPSLARHDHPNERDPNRRIRVGYVSPDFRSHAVGYNVLPLFQAHDRKRFEVFCYSNTPAPDRLTDQFKSLCDSWMDIRNLSDDAAAEHVRQDGIDILVDLALHTAHNRLLLFARKPAPVQVTFAGYPGTTGLAAIDFRLSDPYLDPPGSEQEFYREKTVRLPRSFWCYGPLGDEPVVNGLPADTNGFVTFGCLNNFRKVNEAAIEVWAAVLKAVPSSRLLMMAPSGQARQRIGALFDRHEVDRNRLELVGLQPRRQYLETYHRIDIGLDTFPYNGHTTNLDAAWMGVPVVTRVGSDPVTRAGWSQLSNLGLTELTAATPEDFVTIARDLAADLSRLRAMRSQLRDRMRDSALTNRAGFARGIEAAFEKMWHDWCSVHRQK